MDVFDTYYYDQDHLGNIRQVTDKSGKAVQTTDYYPFGMQLCDGTTSNFDQKHKYNGKEFDKMHGLNTYDYGARQYNPVTARWDRMDPLCEKYYSVSPYAYCMNNPIKFVDPDGEDVHISISNVPDKEPGYVHVYNAEGSKNTLLKAKVPLYQLTVTDDVTNEKSNYLVARDGLATSDGGKTFMNYGFEPPKDTEYDGKITPENYPEGTDLYGICLSINGNNKIPADKNRPIPDGHDKGFAFGILIHVGDEYTDSKGNVRFAGSIGCYCLHGGNAEMERLINDVLKRMKSEGNERIKINIEKRKDIRWEGNGNTWHTEPLWGQ